MFNRSLADNQIATILSNPKTESGLTPAANPFNFGVTNPNPSFLEVIATPGANPSFTVRPKSRFFGPDQVITLTIHAQTANLGPIINTDMTVTVSGTLPDNGLLNHFDPSSVGEPIAQ